MLFVHILNFVSIPFNWLRGGTQYIPLAFGLQVMGILFLFFIIWFLGRLFRV